MNDEEAEINHPINTHTICWRPSLLDNLQQKFMSSHILYSQATWFSRETMYVLFGCMACESIHIHYWYQGKSWTSLCTMILWILICLTRGHVVETTIWYRLIVHFIIYPIVYVLPILIVLNEKYFTSSQSLHLSNWNTKQLRLSNFESIFSCIKAIFMVNLELVLEILSMNKHRILFGTLNWRSVLFLD